MTDQTKLIDDMESDLCRLREEVKSLRSQIDRIRSGSSFVGPVEVAFDYPDCEEICISIDTVQDIYWYTTPEMTEWEDSSNMYSVPKAGERNNAGVWQTPRSLMIDASYMLLQGNH